MAVDKSKLEEDASLRRFYKIVLSWDYLRLLKESSGNKIHKKGKDPSLKKVKDTYKDVNDYLATFEPLMFEEVKANIFRENDEKSGWKEGVLTECNESGGFHLPSIDVGDEDFGTNSDLLLISKKQLGLDAKTQATYAFALVEGRHRGVLRLRMHLNGEINDISLDTEFEPCARLLSMRPLISEINKPWYVMKIFNMSTIVREYVALRSISTLPFKDLILSAADKNNGSEDNAWKISETLEKFIKSSHNESQLNAILAGLFRKGLLLIQGPPGTGKTQTILGILSVLLHATPMRIHAKGQIHELKRKAELSLVEKYSCWKKASPWLNAMNPRDLIKPKDGDDGFFPTSGNEMNQKLLPIARILFEFWFVLHSNSALDEIVLRILKTGICNEDGRRYNPKIVRIGSKAHPSIQSVFHELPCFACRWNKKLAGMDIKTDEKIVGREKNWIVFGIQCLDQAAIVFSTLSTSGSLLRRKFDVVIIDEAAQAVEPATLIPLATDCKQVFLVGDPVQLPATVLSTVAQNLGYGMSLFKRLQQAGYPVTMLKTQYRMHPEIRSFPSKEFYNGELEDGPDLEIQTKRAWHKYKCFGPFCFFDIHEGRDSQPSGVGGSSVNEDEVEFVLNMYHHLVTNYPELKKGSRVAIITPYRSQVKLFIDRFLEMFGVPSKNVIDIMTVERFFQVSCHFLSLPPSGFLEIFVRIMNSHCHLVCSLAGREKDVVFFSWLGLVKMVALDFERFSKNECWDTREARGFCPGTSNTHISSYPCFKFFFCLSWYLSTIYRLLVICNKH
ncbi:probable helicase MAGATAMA 3 [Impatiens glandulifera]|uniref:probable helicase MAGATAMA 3 n=1 Tax=Impatiens glandulifera TaxID=253017 RepID=UPI001FB0DFAF|nr:probable helicase MAGATAMA 3 [Impatiens glandulifera]